MYIWRLGLYCVAMPSVMRWEFLPSMISPIKLNSLRYQMHSKVRADADVISQTDFDNLIGQTIHILGAFTFDDRDEIVIMPVRLEVVDG